MDAGLDLTPLSWEEGHPERAKWTAHTLSTLEPNLQDLNTANDIADFAPNYMSLPDDRRLLVWGESISAVSLFESGWDPCDRFLEEDQGIDHVTGEPVYSEGLLQLSYQDVMSYPELRLPFDWTIDKVLDRTDCNKTILDPYRNLTGGIAILAEQIQRKKIVLFPGYWSTLGDPKHTKVPEIIAMVRKLPFAG